MRRALRLLTTWWTVTSLKPVRRRTARVLAPVLVAASIAMILALWTWRGWQAASAFVAAILAIVVMEAVRFRRQRRAR